MLISDEWAFVTSSERSAWKSENDMLTTPIFVYQNHDIVERRDKKLIRHNFSRRQLGALIRRKRDGDSAISDKNWLAVEFNFRTIAWWTDAKGAGSNSVKCLHVV